MDDAGNFVVVKVDNHPPQRSRPDYQHRRWNYGGITRGISLVEVPETFVEDNLIQLNKGSQGVFDEVNWNCERSREYLLRSRSGGLQERHRPNAASG